MVIETELLPILNSVGKKTLGTLPDFIENLDEYLSQIIIENPVTFNKYWSTNKLIISLAKELNLNDNQLTSLPKEIAQLQQLKSLNLGENPLTSLSKELEATYLFVYRKYSLGRR